MDILTEAKPMTATSDNAASATSASQPTLVSDELIVEIWKSTVEVQQHFNDLQLRLRNFMITIIVAVLGAAALALKEHAVFMYHGNAISVVVIAAVAGIVATLAFWFLDYGYYLLLIASVSHGMSIERKYGDRLPELGLANRIKDGSSFYVKLFGYKLLKIGSKRRMTYFYTGTLLFFAAVAWLGQAMTSPHENAAANALRRYHDSGKYQSHVQLMADRAISYINSLPPVSMGRKRAVIFDIDDTALSTWEILDTGNFAWDASRFEAFVRRANAPAIEPTLNVFRDAIAEQCDVFFVTTRSEALRQPTELNLSQVGYTGFKKVYMKPIDSTERAGQFKLSVRQDIRRLGYEIILNVGDQLCDIEGGLADQTILIPNPFYTVD